MSSSKAEIEESGEGSHWPKHSPWILLCVCFLKERHKQISEKGQQLLSLSINALQLPFLVLLTASSLQPSSTHVAEGKDVRHRLALLTAIFGVSFCSSLSLIIIQRTTD